MMDPYVLRLWLWNMGGVFGLLALLGGYVTLAVWVADWADRKWRSMDMAAAVFVGMIAIPFVMALCYCNASDYAKKHPLPAEEVKK